MYWKRDKVDYLKALTPADRELLFNHPVELNTNEKLEQRLNNIHNNPVDAGIVRYPEEYLYSSAGNYARLKETVMEVRLI